PTPGRPPRARRSPRTARPSRPRAVVRVWHASQEARPTPWNGRRITSVGWTRTNPKRSAGVEPTQPPEEAPHESVATPPDSRSPADRTCRAHAGAVRRPPRRLVARPAAAPDLDDRGPAAGPAARQRGRQPADRPGRRGPRRALRRRAADRATRGGCRDVRVG